MKRIILITGIMGFLYAQTVPDTQWTKMFGGTNSEYSYCVQQTSDGGYVIIGNTNYFGAGLDDIYFVKTDSAGNESWSATFGGADNDYGYFVKQTSDGGYIIVGGTNSFGAGFEDVYLIKTDASGNVSWTKTFGGSDDDEGRCVQQTSDGGFVIVGFTRSFGIGDYDVYLIKTDANGDTSWTRQIGGNADDFGYSVQQTSDGGYIIVGYTNSYGAGYDDIYLIKFNLNGDSVWVKTFGGSNNDYGYCVQQTSDGGYIIAGITYSYGAGGADVYLIKTDANGNLTWAKTFGGSYNDGGYAVCEISGGGYIITGYTGSYGAGGMDVYLIRTDANGDTLWTKTVGGTGDEEGFFIQQTSDQGFITVGYTSSFTVYPEVYLIKLTSEQDVNEYSPVSKETVGLTHFNSHEGAILNLIISRRAEVSLKIYDILGRVIKVPLKGEYSEGFYRIRFRPKRKGIYFYRLESPYLNKRGKFWMF